VLTAGVWDLCTGLGMALAMGILFCAVRDRSPHELAGEAPGALQARPGCVTRAQQQPPSMLISTRSQYHLARGSKTLFDRRAAFGLDEQEGRRNTSVPIV